MSNRRVFAVAFFLIAMTLSQPAAAIEGNWFGWLKRPPPAAPNAPCNPAPITVASPPGPYRVAGLRQRQLSLVWLRLRRADLPVGLLRLDLPPRVHLPLRLLQHLHAMGLRAGVLRKGFGDLGI